jgi:hypothetical protein
MKRPTVTAGSNGKHPGGRPSKFQKCSAQFLKHIAGGLPIGAAAALSGLAESTVFAWLASGRNAQGGAFLEFSEAYTRARGKAQGKMVQEIRKAGRDDWRAIGWLAERMFPETFSVKLRHELTGPDGAPVAITGPPAFPQIRVVSVPNDEFARIAAKPNYKTLGVGSLERVEGGLKIIVVRQSKNGELLNKGGSISGSP